MKKLFFLTFFILLIFSYVVAAKAESFSVKDGQLYLGKERVKLIGANIAFWNKRWEKVTREDLQEDIKQIKQIGNCARIFVSYGVKDRGHFGTLEVRKELLDKLEYFVAEAKKTRRSNNSNHPFCLLSGN